MRDILAPDSARWRNFVSIFESQVSLAGYQLVIPPLVEDVGVFSRIGDATDVVSKEMYDFVDKGGRHIALRPEQTASVCRLFVEHRPITPFKAWYAGSNFRYEKPQRGRFRQFDQVGVEVLGSEDPHVDGEVIALAWNFFASLGLTQVTLAVNSLGDPDDRSAYINALHEYFDSHRGELSAESQVTLERNPLRVLDSKRDQDQMLIANAPSIDEFWSPAAIAHFDEVRYALDILNVPYSIDLRLVRGLDYYQRTTFEFRGGTLGSAQNAIGGGGRYDGLVEDLGGPHTAGVGFALGLDRTLIACDDEGVFPAPPTSVDVFVVDTTDGREALAVCNSLRSAGVSSEQAWDARSMKAQMKSANRSGAKIAVIIGADEASNGTAIIKPLRDDSEQMIIQREALTQSVIGLLND